ncbi:unnamed protein product [marine sediment metagenome]|uniref:YspA cpYpsA-related SLOG domain-containing protein n=1 Tax=marine sediment metagenome TaxID=412755 RepID=X0SHI3_9ZZZZ
MKILVTGTREDLEEFEAMKVVKQLSGHLKEFPGCPEAITIIHGACPTGVDELAGKWAKYSGTDEITFPANWKGRRESAGPYRNRRMMDIMEPDLVLAFPSPRSKGTRNCIREAKKRLIPIEITELE